MIRIGIVDELKLFRKGFSLLLSQLEEIEVVFQCSNGIELFKKLKVIDVDIIFLEIKMPIMDGFQIASLLNKNYPNIKVLVLSSYNDSYSIARMFKYNVSGFLTKNIAFSRLKIAIKYVYNNGIYYDNQISQIINQSAENKSITEIIISDKEVEIIKLYARQYTVNEIADKLNLSTRTIEKYKETLMQKTGSNNFIGVILFAMRWHYINDSDLQL
ncbi:two-component system response regulator [Myroides marinus]|uniref:Two-component system response regulator n=1 Tax=Myroides marinus TaxID=703342 RepID=A0A161S903_9FLAO|nr:response regulator transcription factor [Myroides marinus]KZE76165.1 two-component system response regulator [Myroides marinus]